MKKNLNFLIVSSNFYTEISEELLKGAIAKLDQYDVKYRCVNVPGALEIPLAIKYSVEFQKSNKDSDMVDFIDGYVALGCVIRGETSHYDHVCYESIHGIQSIALQYSVAIGNGIITCENKSQARSRARIEGQNKGGLAATAAFKMIEIKNYLESWKFSKIDIREKIINP